MGFLDDNGNGLTKARRKIIEIMAYIILAGLGFLAVQVINNAGKLRTIEANEKFHSFEHQAIERRLMDLEGRK